MNKTCYICKYTPVELLYALGADCVNLNGMPEGFELAEQAAHPNLCGFGKALLEAVFRGEVRELVLVNCCDTIRSVYDVLEADGKLDFLYLLDMLRSDGSCSIERIACQLEDLAQAYGAYKGTRFEETAFRQAFRREPTPERPYLAVLGARMGTELFQMVEQSMPCPVRNETCVHNRSVCQTPPEGLEFHDLMQWYAGELLRQLPCMRMYDNTGRKQLYNDPNLLGIIYHTVKFCDFYSFEYAQIRHSVAVPLLKIESDYTLQSSGQLQTRLEAFAEQLNPVRQPERKEPNMGNEYVAGVDSGSASTDVVILNRNREMVAGIVLPTGAGAALGAERALEQALGEAGLHREEIAAMVTTGYGRAAVSAGDKSITEISCHARGAHFLDPSVRTVIDIGGQDSKVICLDETGAVTNFVMNDKCAAGTGRFLEMMARTLEMSLEELSQRGIHYRENITISSMCTVFAESEIVSLIAQNKQIDDIVHGLNKAVAAKTASLVRRVEGQQNFMMTGGVSRNLGLVKALEENLHISLLVSDKAQMCGALGAALYALDLIR